MSSPTKINGSPVGAREGQRVILREITASLHNSPPSMALSNKNVNDTVSKSPSEHEVKVKFAREFGDVANYPPPPSIVIDNTNSISSASSFQSLTSTLSTKSSSGICVDSPARSSNTSYNNFEVSGLEDLISACAAIHLGDTTVTGEQSFADATFASATDELNQTRDLTRSRSVSPHPDLNGTQVLDTDLNVTQTFSEPHSPDLNSTQDINSPSIENNCNQDTYPAGEEISPEYATAYETSTQVCSQFDDIEKDKQELNNTFAIPPPPEAFIYPIEVSATSEVLDTQNQQLNTDVQDTSSCLEPSVLPTLENILKKAESAYKKSLSTDNENFDLESSENPLETLQSAPLECTLSTNALQSIPDISTNYLTAINAPTFIESQSLLDITKSLSTQPTAHAVNVEPETIDESCDIPTEQIQHEGDGLPIQEAVNGPILENINNILNPSVAAGADQDSAAPIPILITEEYVPTENFGDCEELDTTVNIDDITTNFFEATESENLQAFIARNEGTNTDTNPLAQADYNYFLPQRQSTSLDDFLPPPNSHQELSPMKSTGNAESEFFDAQNVSLSENQIDFEKLKLAANNIANDIDNKSVDLIDNNDPFASASTDLWRDPTNFDFLLSKKANSATTDRLRAESLYVKFDPLVSDPSMLPQGNGATAPPNEERNGEKEASVPNIGTPKRNPAIAAIDRLLFYSPMSPGNQKSEEPKKIEPTEKPTPEPTPIVDTIMAKELELVRATVIQLEEQLEKQKLEQEQLEKEHKVDREAFQEAVTQLQKQLNQEIKSKNQINVVVDEYEKSISRLVAERERDRNNLDVEKASLLEELQEVKNHLAASEAAFNDVHAKYERLKVVVTASKNNEAALKASIAENVEIIKTLEDRYDQIKTHAAVRLEKANLELEGIRKQHESETLKLRAMLRKEELKSSSLAEMIEQKTKENRELTKILDEVIARVDPGADQ